MLQWGRRVNTAECSGVASVTRERVRFNGAAA